MRMKWMCLIMTDEPGPVDHRVVPTCFSFNGPSLPRSHRRIQPGGSHCQPESAFNQPLSHAAALKSRPLWLADVIFLLILYIVVMGGKYCKVHSPLHDVKGYALYKYIVLVYTGMSIYWDILVYTSGSSQQI
jgi:hypothetical protein